MYRKDLVDKEIKHLEENGYEFTFSVFIKDDGNLSFVFAERPDTKFEEVRDAMAQYIVWALAREIRRRKDKDDDSSTSGD